METRSQRRLAQEQQQRPAYPQIQTAQSAPTSPTSSAFQSSSSLASVASMNNHTQQHTHLQTQQPGFASAPLPSPSASQPTTGYFNSISHQAPTSQPPQQARIPQSQMQTGYVGQRGGGVGGAPETAPFLQDFNLVAEAAKRAQMACLARDLGDVGL